MVSPASVLFRSTVRALAPCNHQHIRLFSSAGGAATMSHRLRYSPSNDIITTLSSRDKRYFTQIKKIRSSFTSSACNDPPVLTKGFYPTAITPEGVYMGSTFLQHPPQPLPQLHAAAFLDPKGYCRTSADATTTISGGDAARRLIRGKRKLMETMRKELQEQEGVKKLYVLRGHGVPEQLLHHHLNVAQQWMPTDDIYEVSVQNLFGALNFDRMLVRTQDGATRIIDMPTEWVHDMELYLTVMTRMANHMSNVFVQEDGLSQPRLKQWNVSVKRDPALPPQLLPNDDELHPVMEFKPMEGSAGRVTIRLQNDDVSMIFESIFDTKQELRGSNFMW